MINSVTNLLTNNTFVNIAQSTRTAMSIETTLKATGRPAFIMMDKNISPETKKYAATKELLYQVTCLGVYMGLVLPVFRKCGFKFFKNHVFKDQYGFDLFKNLDEFSAFKKLQDLGKEERLSELAKLDKKFGKEMFHPTIRQRLQEEKIKKKDYHMLKGADELSSITGSILGLAILAPQVSHVTIHPIMKALGMKPEEQHTNNQNKLNTQG